MKRGTENDCKNLTEQQIYRTKANNFQSILARYKNLLYFIKISIIKYPPKIDKVEQNRIEQNKILLFQEKEKETLSKAFVAAIERATFTTILQ